MFKGACACVCAVLLTVYCRVVDHDLPPGNHAGYGVSVTDNGDERRKIKIDISIVVWLR
jgi:hypothetical protein